MIVPEEQYLAHYGILRKSGRYPWGSGANPTARSKTFLEIVEGHRREGMADKDIAKLYSTDAEPFTSTDLRRLRTIAINKQKQDKINQINRLVDRGWSNNKIGERMGINESTVRSLRATADKKKLDDLQKTADMLKRQVAEKEYVDIGSGVELNLPIGGNPAAGIGLSRDKFQTAVAMLRDEGYSVHTVPVPQLGTGKDTTVKVLAKPGVEWKQVAQNKDKIRLITEHTPDGGESWVGLRPPTNISSKRVGVVWDEDGGSHRDGLIELRPGVKDLDMGGSRYAQVRIAVDKTHYLKGMAVYNADLPAGVDIRFHTNKPKSGNKLDAMKEMEEGPDGKPNLAFPFTSQIKPGGQRGALNIVNEEGDWEKHSKNLPSQMLSKQSPSLAKQQLDVTYERSRKELDKLKELTNPAVKRKLLESFGDEADAAAVHLKAAAMKGQASRVILPVPQVKENEIFAPSFKNGERVSLVRFPHGGTFEIPDLVVNNRNPHARKMLGHNATDAVGINHKVAERLSGADFDGDHVLVIPNNQRLVKNAPPLEGLRGFDPKRSHPPYDGMRTIDGGYYNAATKKVDYRGKSKSSNKQNEMGKITNLIADMTIQRANSQELARAVRHSMVVIDAEKHILDYRGSAEVNGISALKAKYQRKPDGKAGGAATLLTRAGSDRWINERKARPAKEGGPIDKETGKRVFVETKKMVPDRKTGALVPKKEVVDWLSIEDDARKLSSGTIIERVYADHSNRLKALGNEARKEFVNTKSIPYSPSANKAYAKEVASLKAQLKIAEMNAPRERQAQVLANAIHNQRKRDNPGWDKDDIKKSKNQALAEARVRTGADKDRVDISPREWEAITAGAISNHMLEKVLNNGKMENIRELATPKPVTLMTSARTNRAKQMLSSGYTQAEVAEQLGVSLTTLKESISKGGADG